MGKKIYFDVRVDPNAQFDSVNNIPNQYKLYVNGKAADYFILILEGRVKVVIGKENQTYECGSFTYFGVSALKLTPDETEQVSKSTSLGRLSISDGECCALSPELIHSFNGSDAAIAGIFGDQVIGVDRIDNWLQSFHIGESSDQRQRFHTRLHGLLHRQHDIHESESKHVFGRCSPDNYGTEEQVESVLPVSGCRTGQ